MKIGRVFSIDTDPQVFRLAEFMREKQVTHGAVIRVDIQGVQVGKPFYDETTLMPASVDVQPVFFCNILNFDVKKVLQLGDGRALPKQVIVDGLRVRECGYVDILNALVSSNGVIRITVDSESKVVEFEP